MKGSPNQSNREATFWFLWRVFGLPSVLLMIIALGFLTFGALRQIDAVRLMMNGQTVPGQIVQGRVDQTSGRTVIYNTRGIALRPLRSSDTHVVMYTFETSDGPINGEAVVNAAMFRKLLKRRQVQIIYWTKDPTLNEIQSGRREMIARVLMFFGSLILLWSVILGWRSWRKVRSIERAAANSTRYKVKVIHHKDTAGWFRNGSVYLIWDYIGVDGTRYTGQSDALSQMEIDTYPPGTSITIYNDPEKPWKSYWDQQMRYYLRPDQAKALV